MERHAKRRSSSNGIGIFDGFALLVLIGLLSATLVGLILARNPATAARAKTWVRVALSRVSAALSPVDAAANVSR
jgi:hypothetical protein